MNLFGTWPGRPLHSRWAPRSRHSRLAMSSPGLARLGAALGLLALAAVAGRAVTSQHARSKAAVAPRHKPEHLQTWEGEGGGVPVGGSQTASQVAPVPPTGMDAPPAR